jgi:hypothetical protein
MQPTPTLTEAQAALAHGLLAMNQLLNGLHTLAKPDPERSPLGNALIAQACLANLQLYVGTLAEKLEAQIAQHEAPAPRDEVGRA